MDKDYIAHEKAFQAIDLIEEIQKKVCEDKINEAIVSFQQGVTDYFKGDKRLEYSEERCTVDEHYEGGVNFADFLYCTQSDMAIDGIDN